MRTCARSNGRAIAMIEESANPETRHLRRCWDCLISQDEIEMTQRATNCVVKWKIKGAAKFMFECMKCHVGKKSEDEQ